MSEADRPPLDESERQELRAEAREALRRVQDLPGFEERRGQLGETPECAGGWPWQLVRTATEERLGGGFAWVWSDLSGVSDEQRKEALAAINEAGKKEEMLQLSGDRLEVLVPVTVPRPSEGDLDQLDGYVTGVERFAERYLFGAQWSPRALHEALRRNVPIELPTGRPDWVCPPVDTSLTLDPEKPWPREELRYLGEAILDVTGRSARGGLGEARRTTWVHALEAIARRLRPRERLKDLTPANRAEHERRLNRERQALREARKYMNAAVSGIVDDPPS